jgi:hypothetical protein
MIYHHGLPVIPADTRERTRFYPRQDLLPDDLKQDQDYVRTKLRRHNRMLHGYGVLFGLKASPLTDDEARGLLDRGEVTSDEIGKTAGYWNWLKVEPGYALSPVGTEVFLPQPVYVSLDREQDGTLVTRPGPCRGRNGANKKQRGRAVLHLVVEPSECETRPVRAVLSPCGDHPDGVEWSRIADAWVFRLVTKPPDRPYGDTVDPLRLACGQASRDHVFVARLSFEEGYLKGENPLADEREFFKALLPLPATHGGTIA